MIDIRSFLFLTLFWYALHKSTKKNTLDSVHYVIGLTKQIIEYLCGKRTFGKITLKGIVGKENITCLTILSLAITGG